MAERLFSKEEQAWFDRARIQCEEVMESVVVARRLLPQMIKMARRKAMALYKTTYISFIAEKKSWRDCVDVAMVDDDEFFIILHFNVGLPSHAVGYTFRKGVLKNVWN